MSIASEITRLQNAKADIKTSIENKGVSVPSSYKLNEYPALIDEIETSTSIVNGTLKQYKAYTTGGDVTIAPNTFIEMVNEIPDTKFTSGKVLFIDQIDSTHLFVCYHYSGKIYGATATFTNNINIINSTELASTSRNNCLNTLYVKKGNKYVIAVNNYGFLLASVDTNNYTVTSLNTLTGSINYSRYLGYITTENNIDYYGLTRYNNGIWYFQIIKDDNNTLSVATVEQQIFSVNNAYESQGGAIYSSNGKFLITVSTSANNNLYYKFYSYTNETLTELVSNTYTNSGAMITNILNNKLYVCYTRDGYLRANTYTIDFENTTLTNDNINSVLLASTDYYQFPANQNKLSFIDDKLYLFYASSSTPTLSVLSIKLTDLSLIENKLLLELVPNYAFNMFIYIAIGKYNDNYIIATQDIVNGSALSQSSIYDMKTAGSIVIGENLVKESVNKIEGLTKTECTNLTVGDVWVLNI